MSSSSMSAADLAKKKRELTNQAASQYERKMAFVLSTYKKRRDAVKKNDTLAATKAQLGVTKASTVHPLVLDETWKEACRTLLSQDEEKRTPDGLFFLRKYLLKHVGAPCETFLPRRPHHACFRSNVKGGYLSRSSWTCAQS